MTDGFRGLIAAPHTPLGLDGQIALDAVEAQARHLAGDGVIGAFVAGTTGEGMSLSVAERMALTERWVEAGRSAGLQVIVQVGHNCLPDAQRLAAHAREVGADAIATLAPSFFRPTEIAPLVDFCGAIADHAPETPFYFYDIPKMTGVSLPTAKLLVALRGRIPQLAGVKYTNPDLKELQKCLEVEGGRLDVLFGQDEALLSGLALGAHGAVGSTYNFAAPLYHRIIEAFRAGDLETARQLQAHSVRLVETLAGYGFLPAAKTLMSFLGVDCGTVRSPLTPLAPEQIDAMRADLDRIGFFDWGRTPAVAGSSDASCDSRPSTAAR